MLLLYTETAITNLAVDSGDGHLVERGARLGAILESVHVHCWVCCAGCGGEGGGGRFADMARCVLVSIDAGTLWTCSVSHRKL